MKRRLLQLSAAIAALVAVGYVARDQLVDRAARYALDRASRRVGLALSCERAQLADLNTVRVFGLRVGLDEWVKVDAVEVRLEPGSLLRLDPRPRSVYLDHPVLYLEGEDLPSSLAKLKERVERVGARLQRGPAEPVERNAQGLPVLRAVDPTLTPMPSPSPTPTPTPSPSPSASLAHAGDALSDRDLSERVRDALARVSATLARLPTIDIARGEVQGARGQVALSQVRLQLSPTGLAGTWEGEAPATGRCGVNATLDAARLRCEGGFTYALNPRLQVSGQEVSWLASPTPTLYLQGFQVASSGALLASLPFSHVKLDVSVGLIANGEGQRPIDVTLKFPGGGAVSASGRVSREGGDLRTSLNDLPAESLSARARGYISADVQLRARWREGEVRMEGEVSGRGLVVEHEALAEAPIGPFSVSARGVIGAEWEPREPARFRAYLQRGVARLGELRSEVSVDWDQRHALPRLEARFKMDRAEGQTFASSLPPMLMPNLQPLTLKGPIALSGELRLDMSDLEATTLNVSADLKRLKVLGHSDRINLAALKEVFTTTFVMPDGETIYTREVGPKTERWLPLSEAPPLLTQAIIAQEDGGFYKHGGVSLFHLRGSLIRNLSEGRFARGGSTLTMQLTRNLFLHRKKTLSRKLEELCLTWFLEQNLSKNEIIELYINIVELGEDVFGFKEAAERYFGKRAQDLRPEEIAALTRMLPGPRLYQPSFERKQLSKAYATRTNRLLALLEQRGLLPKGGYRAVTQTNLWEPYGDEGQGAQGGAQGGGEQGGGEQGGGEQGGGEQGGGEQGGARVDPDELGDLDAPDSLGDLWGTATHEPLSPPQPAKTSKRLTSPKGPKDPKSAKGPKSARSARSPKPTKERQRRPR